MEVQKRPSIDEISTFMIQSTGSWMSPIISFLQDGHLPQDIKEARKVKKRAARFMILNDALYKRGFSMPYLKCLDEEEAKYMLEEVHEGFYGDHTGPRSLVDAKELVKNVKKCNKCQRFGIPRTIISNNGRKFNNQNFRDFCSGLGIKNQFSSPGHPQANGQTDVTNRTLLKIIKAKLDDAEGTWP
ncbi:uncharacterized protein LOC142623162 [Castanea sativa]|uniref:uncharacterized protein LOC142623162 n=1 Tax=Castanea sativa TaxID=21020 RepID=UPI003F64C2CE